MKGDYSSVKLQIMFANCELLSILSNHRKEECRGMVARQQEKQGKAL